MRKDWLFFSVRALLLGVLLSMPSLLPSLEWMPLSRRAGGLDPAETLMFSANWYDYLCFVVSQPLGDLTLRLSNYRSLVQTFSIGPLYGSAFISPFVFSLALMGSCPKGGLLKNLTIAMTIAFALLAYGANVPFAASLVKIIPGASLLRFPSKLLIFCVFGLALLAARGLRNYCRGTAKPVIQIALWAVPAVLALVLTTANSTVLLPFINNVTEVKTVLEAQKLVFSGLFIWSSLAVLQAVILLVLLRLKRINLAAQISCCMVAIALLYHALSICQLGAKPDYFSQPSYLVNTLKRLSGLNSNEAIRFGPYNIQNLTIPDAYQSTDPLQATISAAQYSRQILNGYTNLDFGIQSLRGYEGAMKGDYFFYCMDVYGRSSQYVSSLKGGVQDKATDLPLARLSQLAACRYAVTQSWRDLPNQGSPVNIIRTPVVQLDSVYFEKSAQDEATNLCIYKVKDPMPRAYLSFAWKTSDSHQQVLNEIGGDTSSKFDPHQFSFVEGDNLPPDSPDIQNNSVAGSSSEQKFLAVPFVEPEPEKIAISTATDKPAMLVLADQYYPGWTASVDGTPAEILRCNGFMRAVYLLPGKHQVEFSYFPSSVRNGLLLAAIAIVWQLLLLFQSLRPSRPL